MNTNIWQQLCDASVTTGFDILYTRLSRDTGEDGLSESIENQREILVGFAAKNGFDHPVLVIDDGKSGTNWDRDGWQAVLAQIESDNVRSIIVKNKDRLGRDYLRVGLYMEMFRERNIRFIAVSDGVDNIHEDDDFAPFRDIIAEFYARDTSRKIKAVLHNKGHNGKPMTNIAPYGFKKDPGDHNHWLVDDESAAVVRRIFQMTIDGKGPFQIAKTLTDEQIIRPSCHIARLAGCVSEKSEATPYRWTDATIVTILRRPEYMGHTVNFRTYKTSFKTKKHKENPPEKWEIFENTHEAIIDAETWETAQKCRKVKRRVKRADGEANPLTGLVYCGTCGSRMYNHRGTNYSETRPSQDSYCCTKYSKYPPECTRHNISVKNLRELILTAIRNTAGYVREHEGEFVEKLREAAEIKQNEQAKAQRKQLAADKRRVDELDNIIKRLFEDKFSGTLTEKRFLVLSKQYEVEQETLEARIEATEIELAQFAADSVKVDKFIEIVRKYTSFEELTPAMLTTFIDKIVVHEAERPRGQRNQRVDIYLNYIGQFTPPGCEQTFPEYVSPEDKRKAYHRERYQRNKEKILADCAERYAAKKAAAPDKPEPSAKTAEELAAEQAARQEHHKAYQREYQRNWRQKRKAEQDDTPVTTAACAVGA